MFAVLFIAPTPAKATAILFEAVNQIQTGVMPLPRYRRLHPEAIVTAGDLAVLRKYLLVASLAEPATQRDVDAADAQYHRWISAGRRSLQPQSAPNGIPFPSGYKNWKVISSTDRTDQNTFKIILGNDVAMRAISDHNINPWPDGTVLAKVLWQQEPERQGVTRTGEFGHAGFMIKDSRKYASTAGWGWAQWNGIELKPLGKDPTFVNECVACHAPLRKNDYVFTTPIAGNIAVNQLNWGVITSGVDRKSSTFGNDAAVRYARNNVRQYYPADSAIAVATWHQQEDCR
jgi:hypothetical protein